MKGPVHDHDLRQIARIARRAGWTIELTGRTHLRWTSPDGEVIMGASTPSRGRHAFANFRQQLKRAGLEIP